MVSALYREQAARFAVDVIRGELLPTVQLEANYTKRYDPSVNIDETETTLVTGRVTVPFYTGGEVQARVRQAKHTHVQRLQEIEQARSEVQAGGDGVVAAGSGARRQRSSTLPPSMPTASRWPACARRSGWDSARCSTC